MGPADRSQGQIRPHKLLPHERQHPGRIARAIRGERPSERVTFRLSRRSAPTPAAHTTRTTVPGAALSVVLPVRGRAPLVGDGQGERRPATNQAGVTLARRPVVSDARRVTGAAGAGRRGPAGPPSRPAPPPAPGPAAARTRRPGSCRGR